MAKCSRCGKRFSVSSARQEYNAEFGEDFDYDMEYGGDVCADCAIDETGSNMAQGRAIDMMNDDEDYDADFVEKWL